MQIRAILICLVISSDDKVLVATTKAKYTKSTSTEIWFLRDGGELKVCVLWNGASVEYSQRK